MTDATGDSVTVWIASLKAGDAAAAGKLWRRYFEALVRLARDRLAGAAGRGRRGGRGPQRLRQLLPGRGARPISPAGRPRRPLAAAGRHHRAQGPRPGPARAAAEARRRARSSACRPDWPTATGRGTSSGVAAASRPPSSPRWPPTSAAACSAAPRRLAPPGRPPADGGLHQRGDRRPARLQPADRRPEARADPPDLDRRGGDRNHERRAEPDRRAAPGRARPDRPGLRPLRGGLARRGPRLGSRTTSARSRPRTAPPCCATCWPRSSTPAAASASGPEPASISTVSPATPRRSRPPSPRPAYRPRPRDGIGRRARPPRWRLIGLGSDPPDTSRASGTGPAHRPTRRAAGEAPLADGLPRRLPGVRLDRDFGDYRAARGSAAAAWGSSTRPGSGASTAWSPSR